MDLSNRDDSNPVRYSVAYPTGAERFAVLRRGRVSNGVRKMPDEVTLSINDLDAL